MPPAADIRIRDVQKLEEDLQIRGETARMQFRRRGLDDRTTEAAFAEVLVTWNEWFREVGSPRKILTSDVFAWLCECARTHHQTDDGRLAIGLLMRLMGDFPAGVGTGQDRHDDLGRFAVFFCLRRLAEITGASPAWGEVQLTPADEGRASMLTGDPSIAKGFSDEQLKEAVRTFCADHGGSSDLFGRFAQDLARLGDVLEDPAASDRDRHIARAALEYFRRESDAIPDHLGMIGLIDDVFVVRRAIESIDPTRAAIAKVLDEVVRDSPFLPHVHLGDGERERALGEFMLVNFSMIASRSGRPGAPGGEYEPEIPKGKVLVLPGGASIVVLLGWLRALVNLHASIDLQAREFEPGDRLVILTTRAESEFSAYGRLDGVKFVACERSRATHFQVATCGRAGAGKSLNSYPIAELAAFGLSNRSTKRHRRGDIKVDAQETPLGPLARLFGLPRTVSVPQDPPIVIVVAPRGLAESVLAETRLAGEPLSRVLPVERAEVRGHQLERRPLETNLGGTPLLTLVADLQEARWIVETNRYRRPVTVLAAIKHGAVENAAELDRLIEDGAETLFVLEEGDSSSIEALARNEKVLFWNWSEDWVRSLHRMPREERGRSPEGSPESQASHGGAFRSEAALWRRAEAAVHVIELEVSGVSDAAEALRLLETEYKSHPDILLQEWIASALRALLETLQTLGANERLPEMLRQLDVRAGEGRRSWHAPIPDVVALVRRQLELAMDATVREKPKTCRVLKWAKEHGAGRIFAPERIRQDIARDPELSGLSWWEGRRGEQLDVPLLVPAWLGRARMQKLLEPALSTDVTLLLTRQEAEWYASFRGHRVRSRDRLTKLSRARPALRVDTSRATDRREAPPPAGREGLDEAADRLRREISLRKYSKGDQNASEPVKARLVYFAGGWEAAYGTRSAVLTVTHLFSETRGEADGSVREVLPSQLVEGDRVLARLGSDTDAIRKAADEFLKPGLRARSSEWRAALGRFFGQRSRREMLRRLRDAGCMRAERTIIDWVEDDRVIGPMDDADVDAIAKATGDDLLVKGLAACKAAIVEVRSAHRRAGQVLAEKVVAKAAGVLRSIGKSGRLPEIVEIDESLLLLTVESVDTETVDVPRHVVNQVRAP